LLREPLPIFLLGYVTVVRFRLKSAPMIISPFFVSGSVLLFRLNASLFVKVRLKMFIEKSEVKTFEKSAGSNP
jgi:hypothetical protein